MAEGHQRVKSGRQVHHRRNCRSAQVDISSNVAPLMCFSLQRLENASDLPLVRAPSISHHCLCSGECCSLVHGILAQRGFLWQGAACLHVCCADARRLTVAVVVAAVDLMETLPAARCKRRRMSDELWTSGDCPTAPLSVISRQFFTVHKGGGVFETEEWRGGDKTMFRPVVDDLMVGMQRVEQVTCQDGSFFVTDLMGRYSRTVSGKVVHLWRFDKTQRRLYISRSLLFTNTAEFVAVQQFLQHL